MKVSAEMAMAVARIARELEDLQTFGLNIQIRDFDQLIVKIDGEGTVEFVDR